MVHLQTKPEHQTEFDSVQNLTVKQSRISKKFIEISYHVDVYNTQAKFSLNTICDKNIFIELSVLEFNCLMSS